MIINKYILDFIYLMPWKLVCDLWFHKNQRLQTNFHGIKYIKSNIYLFIIII